MKEKKKSINSKLKKISIVKLFAAIVLLAGMVFSLTRTNTISSYLKSMFDAGQTPAHSKTKLEKNDGTTQLELTVTGDADTDVQTAANVNVLIVYDESSSMTSNNVTTNPNRNRADYAEDVVHDFIVSLQRYQSGDGSNIQVALVGFGPSATTRQTWTSNLGETGQGINRFFDDGVDGTVTSSHNYSRNNGTNWYAALSKANDLLNGTNGETAADADPTFVILVTDGAPTAAPGETTIAPSSSRPWTDYRVYYRAAAPEAYDIQSRDKTTLFGIYAYGTEADLLDELIYYSNNGSHRVIDGYNVNTATSQQHDFGDPEPTDNYYSASNTEALNKAIEDIFQTIVNALGISSVEINDGTTSHVETTSGTISELLKVDTQSYKYWLEVPLVNNKFTRIDLVSGDSVEYTVTDNNNGTFTISWGTGSNSKSVTVTGEKTVSSLKYQWTGKNDLYNYDPPTANFNSETGAVEWKLNSVGTLLDGVTYSVTFDVFPSQYTMDKIAQIKNGATLAERQSLYNALDANEREYIEPANNQYTAFTLKTNTTATMSYVDTRTGQSGSTTYTNPDPVATETETMDIQKIWEKALDSAEEKVQNIDVGIIRDNNDEDVFFNTTLSSSNNWSYEGINMAPGLMKVEGSNVRVLNPGHDYKFAELDENAYKWELKTQTVHPMRINEELCELILIDENVADQYTKPTAMTSNTNLMYYTDGTNTYYRLTAGSDKIYVLGDTNVTVTATNHRRSNLNISKIVGGNSADPEDEFNLTITVNDPGLTKNEKIWFSARGADGNVDFGNLEDQGWYKEEGDSWSGYYYANSGTELNISIKQGVNIRFTNLTDEANYTIVEAEKTGYIYSTTSDNFSGEQGVTVNGELQKVEFTPEATINSSTRTITGNIDRTNSNYTINVYNVYEKVDVEVTKTWDDGSNQDGKRQPITIELLKEGEPTGQTVTIGTDQDEVTESFTGLDRFNSDRSEINYSVKENTTIEGYTMGTPSCTNNGGKYICTVTNSHTPSVTSVSGTKTWTDDDNRDNLRPTSIFVQLNKTVTVDGTRVTSPVGEPKEVTGPQWKYSWTNLPEYENGEKIVYTVTENITDFDDYTPDYKENSYDIENIYSAQTTDVTVTKIWNDDDDRDGVRPDDISVTITPDDFKVIPGTTPQVATVTLNEGNSWTHTWTNLFVNSTSHKPNQYTVTEAQESGYLEPVIKKIGNNGFVYEITNTHEIIPVEISGTKTWDDDSNRDGVRPESITIKVLADGNPVKVKDETTEEEKDLEVTISAADAVEGNPDVWAYSLGNLPKYKDGGVEIVYTVEEKLNFAEGTDPIPTYTRTDDKEGLDIVNTYEPELYNDDTGELTLTKIWNDDNNRDGIRENETFKLTATITNDEGQTVTVPYSELGTDESNMTDNGTFTMTVPEEGKSYSFKITGLYKNYQGKPISYTLEETSISEDDPYTAGAPDYSKQGVISLTNTHEPELYNDDTGELTLTKIWDDDSNRDGVRENETFKLTATITNDDGETVTVPYSELGTDESNMTSDGTFTMTAPTDKDTYSFKITGLYLKYQGKEIEYTLEETSVSEDDPYTAGDPDYSVDGVISLTNTYEPELYNDDTGELTLTKIWDDDSNRDGIRENETFKLTATITNDNGETVTVPYSELGTDESNMTSDGVFTMTAPTDTDSYSFKITGLYKNYQEKEINYTLEETSVSEDDPYTAGDPDYSKKGEISLTNTYEPELYNDDTGELTLAKIWDDDSNRDKVRENETFKLTATITNDKGETVTVPYSELGTDESNMTSDGTFTMTAPTDKDSYSFKITGLYLKYQGKDIEYTLEETSTSEDDPYVASDPDYSKQGEISLTNTYTPNLYNETGEITVEKIWDDEDDRDGIRAKNNITSVKVKLIATNAAGVAVPYNEIASDDATVTIPENMEFTLLESDDYTLTLDGLYENYQGKLITYTFEEVGDFTEYGYERPSVSATVDKVEITNSYSPEVTSVSGEKKWEDDDNRDNLRPEYIMVQLHQTINGETTNVDDPVRVDDSTEWKYSWTGLPKNFAGEAITYTVTETTDLTGFGYEAPDYDGYNVINNYSALLTQVKVTKHWEDDNNRDNLRTPNVTVTLTPGDFKVIPGTIYKEQSATVELNEVNSWTHTWTNLFVHNTSHQTNEYTVSETPVSGYDDPVVEKVSEDEFEFLVTNNRTPDLYNETGEITVIKNWDDNNDQDGIRKNNNITSVVVKLSATTEDGAVPYDEIATDDATVTIPKNMEFTLTESEDYSLTLDGLYANYQGKAITYTFDEVGNFTEYGYDMPTKEETADTVTITNHHTPELYNENSGELEITKYWDDDNNRDGLREDVTIELIIDGERSGRTITLGTTDGSSDKFTELPRYRDGGIEIVYEIVEVTEIDGYTYPPTYDTSTVGSFTVTNEHDPELYNNDTGELTLTKIWEDDSDRDGIRTSETFKLTATITNDEGEIVTVPYSELGTDDSNMTSNGEFVMNITEGENETSFLITGLYKNYQGKPITYTLEEITDTEDDGYEASDPDYSVEGVISLTNTHGIEVADITITKSWIDDSNADHTRPESVTLYLWANETEQVGSVTLTEEDMLNGDINTWAHTFNNLPVNDGGKTIKYSVTEDAVANYTADYPEGELTAINTLDDQKRTIDITKYWDDNSDNDGYRDDVDAYATLIGNITVNGETEEVVHKEMLIPIDSDEWSTSVEVPIYSRGYKITYSLTENDIPEYSTTIEDKEVDGKLSFTITNSHEPETIDEKVVTKTWDDNNNQDGMRPESITITLLANDEPTNYTATLTSDNATGDNTWSYTFYELPKFSDKEEIVYTVVEEVEGNKYERTDDYETLDIINSHEPETITYVLTKIWSDDYDRDGKRPESITVQLLANGEAYGEPTVITIEEAVDFNTWSHTFDNLPKYLNGEPVEYTISEESIAYYTPGQVTPVNANYENDEYTDADNYNFDGELENTHIPELVHEDDDDPDNDGQITVTKTWDDEDNKYSSRPESITVLLFADGVEIGTAELSEENGWTYTFYEDYDGNPLYKYRDQGIVIVYSIGEIKVANYETIINEFNITNKYNGPVPEITPPNTGIIYSNKDNSLIELFILFVTLTSTVIFRKKLED